MLCAALRSRWEQLGFADDQVRFDPGTAKKDRPHVVPLTPELRATLEMQLSRRTAECRECPFVFSLAARKMGVFRKSWWNTCVRVGLGLFFLRALREASNTKEGCAVCSQEKKQKKLRYVGLIFCDSRRTAPECRIWCVLGP
jgi:hypothetical protein